MAEQELKTRVVTPEVVLSYPHLLTPQANSNGKPKFSSSLILLPGADMAGLQRAAMAAATAKYGDKAAELFRTKKIRSPFRTDWEAKNYPKDSVFLNVRSEQRPLLVFPNLEPVPMDRITEVFYPGCIVKASVTAFAYNREGNQGISFGLNTIQFIRDGERLDNRVAPEDEFEAVDLSQAPADLPDELNALLG